MEFKNDSERLLLIAEVDQTDMEEIEEIIEENQRTMRHKITFVNELVDIRGCAIDFSR